MDDPGELIAGDEIAVDDRAGDDVAVADTAGDDMAGDDIDEAGVAAAELLLLAVVVFDPHAASVAARATPQTRVTARLINISAPVGRCAGKSGDDERAALG